MNKLLFALGMLCSFSSLAQVNLQTGAAEAGFPLFQYTDAKSRLTTSLSLTYISGSGLKSNDVAGSVGTGWALQAGGIISRIQHGAPDDQNFANPNNWPAFKEMMAFSNTIDMTYNNGYMYTDIPASTPFPNEVCYSPIFTNVAPFEYKPNFEDREQDVYMFEFNGRSGYFVIGKDQVPQILDDSKLKISFETTNMEAQKIRTRISSFKITDEEGIYYKFAQMEVTDLFKYTNQGLVNGYKILKGADMHSGALNKVVNKWFLTEIGNPLNGEKITFQYETFLIDMDGPKHLSRQDIQNEDKHPSQLLIERIRRTSSRLISITYPDKYRINFNYGSTTRVDLPGDKPLTDVNVLYNNNLLYGYHFNYGYFYRHEVRPYSYSFTAAEKRYVRLCLTDFNKIGSNGTALPPYKFNYNLPVQNSLYYYCVAPNFSLWSDHWGYYNYNTNNVLEDENGNPLAGFSPKVYAFTENTMPESWGMIKSIEYPEGGSIQYEYQHNKDAASTLWIQKAPGVRVFKTTAYDGVSHTNDIIKLYQYVKADGTSSGWGFEMPQYSSTTGLRQYKVTGNVKSGINVKEVGASFVQSMFSTRMAQMAHGALGGSLFNSGTMLKATIEVIVVYIIAEIINNLFTPDFKDYTVLQYKSDNINETNPLPHQYSRVEVIDEGANNGKVVYEFTNPATGPGYQLRDAGPFIAPYSSGRQRYAHWLYGQPSSVTWFNNTNQEVKKVINEYNPIVREINSANYLSRTYEVNNNVAIDAFQHNLLQFNSSFVNTETFYPIQGRLELTKTTDIVYNSNNESTTTETSFTYSPYNLLPRTVIKKDSRGSLYGTTTFYSADYNIPGIINDMKDRNIINAQVNTGNWIQENTGATKKLVNETVTDYAVMSDFDIRPAQLFQSELSAPVDNGVPDPTGYLISYKDNSWLKPQAVMIYNNGNVVQTTRISGNASNSTLFDYDQRLPVAHVANATKDEIKYTSFEAESSGGFAFNTSGIVNEFCPTGKRCYNLASGAITSGSIGSINKPFIISLWTSGSQVTVTASSQVTPSKTGPTINGWTYYEYLLPAGLLPSFTITGNGLLDELRYYPKGASMVSTTYNPGVGKTSECDDNNHIVRFEYDGLGRLIKERDQYNNLIKTYEYNYKQ